MGTYSSNNAVAQPLGVKGKKNQSIDKSSKYKKRAEIIVLQLSKPYINLTTVESINRHNNSRVFIPIGKYLHSLSTRALKSKILATNIRHVFVARIILMCSVQCRTSSVKL